MRDVGDKFETLREAAATSVVRCGEPAEVLLARARADKGDALEVARVAGIMAAKNTAQIIPFCHPLAVAHAAVSYDVDDHEIVVTASCRCIGPTGVEIEALTAASVAALTIYDMLKPHTDELAIVETKLASKTGGKSDYRRAMDPPVRAVVLVADPLVGDGAREDAAGAVVAARLDAHPGIRFEHHEVIGADSDALVVAIERHVADGVELIVVVGGTGLGDRDIAVDTIAGLIDTEVPGMAEAARSYGQRRTPLAMLSRGVAGLIGATLVLTMPGSRRGAAETCDALLPSLPHAFKSIRTRRLAPLQP